MSISCLNLRFKIADFEAIEIHQFWTKWPGTKPKGVILTSFTPISALMEINFQLRCPTLHDEHLYGWKIHIFFNYLLQKLTCSKCVVAHMIWCHEVTLTPGPDRNRNRIRNSGSNCPGTGTGPDGQKTGIFQHYTKGSANELKCDIWVMRKNKKTFFAAARLFWPEGCLRDFFGLKKAEGLLKAKKIPQTARRPKQAWLKQNKFFCYSEGWEMSCIDPKIPFF